MLRYNVEIDVAWRLYSIALNRRARLQNNYCVWAEWAWQTMHFSKPNAKALGNRFDYPTVGDVNFHGNDVDVPISRAN